MKQKLLKSHIGRLRIIAFLEGISFLVLLGIAMPLKYYAGMPLAVKVVGLAHGIFFVLFIFSLIVVKIYNRWPLTKTFIAFLASLLPFGTFVLDYRMLKKEMDEKNN